MSHSRRTMLMSTERARCSTHPSGERVLQNAAAAAQAIKIADSATVTASCTWMKRSRFPRLPSKPVAVACSVHKPSARVFSITSPFPQSSCFMCRMHVGRNVEDRMRVFFLIAWMKSPNASRKINSMCIVPGTQRECTGCFFLFSCSFFCTDESALQSQRSKHSLLHNHSMPSCIVKKKKKKKWTDFPVYTSNWNFPFGKPHELPEMSHLASPTNPTIHRA